MLLGFPLFEAQPGGFCGFQEIGRVDVLAPQAQDVIVDHRPAAIVAEEGALQFGCQSPLIPLADGFLENNERFGIGCGLRQSPTRERTEHARANDARGCPAFAQEINRFTRFAGE